MKGHHQLVSVLFFVAIAGKSTLVLGEDPKPDVLPTVSILPVEPPVVAPGVMPPATVAPDVMPPAGVAPDVMPPAVVAPDVMPPAVATPAVEPPASGGAPEDGGGGGDGGGGASDFQPTGKFDLSPQDILDLCTVVDGAPPPMGPECVYMKWVPCDGDTGDGARPCGWYQQTKCGTDRGKRNVDNAIYRREYLESHMDIDSSAVVHLGFPYK